LYGLNHEEHSIMLDVDLRVGLVSVMMFDFMHVFFVTGLYNFELFNLFEYLKHHQVSHSMLESFASRFKFPRCYAAEKLFVEHNWGSDHWKGSASDGARGIRDRGPLLALHGRPHGRMQEADRELRRLGAGAGPSIDGQVVGSHF
jgi:hypothetical protein